MWCFLFLWRRHISLCHSQACAKFSERDTLIVMDPVLKEIKFPHEGKVSDKHPTSTALWAVSLGDASHWGVDAGILTVGYKPHIHE